MGDISDVGCIDGEGTSPVFQYVPVSVGNPVVFNMVVGEVGGGS